MPNLQSQLPYASLINIWPGMPRDRFRRSLFVAFGAFFDESCDKNNTLFSVSCLIADGKEIEKLERQWAARISKTNERLIRDGRKPISRYHASELNARDNEFDGWKPEESREFSKHLLRLIRQRKLYAIAHAVFLRDFAEVFPDVSDDPKGAAYQHAMMNCLLFALRNLGPIIPRKLMATEGISVVYDRTKEFGPRAATAFNKVRDDPGIKYRECLNSIAEGNALSHIALQPADLLAYEIARDAQRKLFSSSKSMRIFFRKMVHGDGIRVHSTYSDKRYFEELKQAEIKRREHAGLGI